MFTKHSSRCTERVLLGAILVAALCASASAEIIPTLWGVDEQQGMLFSIGDYTNPTNTTTLFGELMYDKHDKHGKLTKIGTEIEAFTIDADGTAYMALNKKLSGFGDPVLLTFNLHSASTTAPNVATIVGEIDVKGNITGLSIDPVSGDLYGLYNKGGSSAADHLVTINRTTGKIAADIGEMSGLSYEIGDGEDLAFDHLANLYVTDNRNDRLYQVDAGTGQILALLDADEGRCVKYEALAWDLANNRLIGSETQGNLLTEMTFETGNNASYGRIDKLGLKDVEGMAFAPAMPEPTTILTLVASMPLILLRRRAKGG